MKSTLRTRNGNAIVLAIGAITIAAAVMVSTTDSAVNAVVASQKDLDRQRIISAVGATLVRREKLLTQAASLGAEGFVRRFDPAYTYNFATDGFVGQDNYGVDWIGDVQVRWKVEPVKTSMVDNLGKATGWRQNPRPDGEQYDLEIPNTFLFQLTAEGRLTDGTPAGNSIARVQGVRYTTVNKEPLFRYIIFYSQEGPKGDLELTHGPEFVAKGSVHTNAALYWGGNLGVNDWGSINGSAAPTRIGPDKDGLPVLVNAFDGIFRLSKHTLYSVANNMQGMMTGTNPVISPTWYETSRIDPRFLAGFPGEVGDSARYPQPNGGSIDAATLQGSIINPNRVRDPTLATRDSVSSGRFINQTGNDLDYAMFGIDSGGRKANDSRDRFRAVSDKVWSFDSLAPIPIGFNRKARSQDNGGRRVRLPAIMSQRAFEAQKIRYDDVDGDTTTDNHEYARPLFLRDGAESTQHTPGVNGKVIESPGSYMNFAMGENGLAFQRVWRDPKGTIESADVSNGYNAWRAIKSDGSAPSIPPTMGLVIRERMMPDQGYYVTTRAVTSGPSYLPYAYGKLRPVRPMPLTMIDVSANVGSDEDGAAIGLQNGRYGFLPFWDKTVNNVDWVPGIDPAKSQQTYAGGGSLTMQAANLRSIRDARSPVTGDPGREQQQWYRGNWRMAHLLRSTPDPALAGLQRTAFNDFDPSQDWRVANGWLGPMGGQVVDSASGVVNGINENAASLAAIFSGSAVQGTGSDRNYYSLRYTGFIKSDDDDAYTFICKVKDATASDESWTGVRMWIDNQLVLDRWELPNKDGRARSTGENNTRSALERSSSPVSMNKDAWVPIVIECYTANSTKELLTLEWKASRGSRSLVPSTQLCRPAAGLASSGLIAKNDLESIRIKLTPNGGPDTQKLGLMLRPVLSGPATTAFANGLPQLVQGQDPYLALCWNPRRGIFAEYRQERVQTTKLSGPWFVGYANDNPNTGTQVTSRRGEVFVKDPGNTTTRIATLSPLDLGSTAPSYSSHLYNDKTGPTYANLSVVDMRVLSEGIPFNVPQGVLNITGTHEIRKQFTNKQSHSWTFSLANTDPAFSATQVFIPGGDKDEPLLKSLIAYASSNSSVGSSTPFSNAAFTNFTPLGFTATWTNSNSTAELPWADTSSYPQTTLRNVTINGTSVALTTADTVVTANRKVQRTISVGNANTIWYNRSNRPYGLDIAAFTAKVTAYYTEKGLGTPVIAEYDSSRNDLWTDLNVPVSTAPDVPVSVTDPNYWTSTTPFTFALNRGSGAFYDSNSFITARGAWSTTPKVQTRPNLPVDLPESVAPRSGSVRPDLWNYLTGTSAPGIIDRFAMPRQAGYDGAAVTDTISQNQTGSTRWTSDLPTTMPAIIPSSVWLRIDRSTSNKLTLLYSFVANPTAPSDWTTVEWSPGVAAEYDISSWVEGLLAGPCVQSGNVTVSAAVSLSDMQVTFRSAQGGQVAKDGDGLKLNAADWDKSDDVKGDERGYLASQYQVFFGPYEITEDFFDWLNKSMPASDFVNMESWLYQHREFWSQSRWWEDGVEKDQTRKLPSTLTDPPTLRELLAKTTIFTLDMQWVQAYLKARTIAEATTPVVGLRTNPISLNSGLSTPAETLASRFNGLFHVTRTNRYPWNPNLNGANPWNPALPNATNSGIDNDTLLALAPSARATRFSSIESLLIAANQTTLNGGTAVIRTHLRPDDVIAGLSAAESRAPAFKPTRFSHGVRLMNGQKTDWAFSGLGTPDFGTGKSAIVTPNPIYIQGDFNTWKPTVKRQGSPSPEWVPMAVMADQIHVLSAGWSLSEAQKPGITADANGLTAACAGTSLSRGGSISPTMSQATGNVSVVAALVTHNQPTTKQSVINGEAASIVNIIQFIEDWATTNRTFTYTGSLVVMDSRRCTESYLLDGTKSYGLSPFGFMGASWRTVTGKTDPTKAWDGAIPQAYAAPNRVFIFNSDFLTPQGTPPFAPFGTSARGIGGWITVVQ